MSNERENEWVLVPRVASLRMLGAGCDALYNADWKDAPRDLTAEAIWIAMLAAAPAPVRGTHCQNGRADVCLASQWDGVICADDECDIDSGIRAAAPAPAVDEPCRRHDCARVRAEMQAEIDRLRSVSVGEAVAYLDLGAGGYMDLGSDLHEEQLAQLPKGRHMLAIIGTYGVDGYTTAPPAPHGAAELQRDAAMFRWLADYPNAYTAVDLLRADQYTTLRRCCEALMPFDAAIAAQAGEKSDG